MNLLDLMIVLVAVSAGMGGWRLGFLARAASWVGLAAGLVLAAHFLPDIVKIFADSDPTTKLLIAVALLVGGAFAGQALGLLVGSQFHRALPLGPLRLVDRGFGAAVGVLGVLLSLWLILPAMADVPGWPARQSRTSLLASVVHDIGGRPPDALDALRRLVGDNQISVFTDPLHRSSDPGPPPAASGLDPALVARVSKSTVKVYGVACRQVQEGSGFVVSRNTVLTNAHVVAGQKATSVLTVDGKQLKGTVTVFDPDRDLALVAVPGLDSPPLPVAENPKIPATGAVFGHPGGQDQLRVAPARVQTTIVAVGRDLYDSHTTRRSVFVMASDLHPGDSGGAVVDPAGTVIGVAFAIAPDRAGTAYALAPSEVRAAIEANRGRPVTTGSCLTG